MHKYIIIILVFSSNCISGFNTGRDGFRELEVDLDFGPAAARKDRIFSQKKSFQEFIQQEQRKAKRDDSMFIRTKSQQEELDKKLLEVAGYEGEPAEHNTMIQALLDMGASANYVREDRCLFMYCTALHGVVGKYCIRSEDLSASIQTLISARARVEPCILNAALTGLCIDSAKRLALITTLLKAKGNVNAVDSNAYNAVTNITYCLDEKEACAVFSLFMQHADPKPDFKDGALQEALKRGRFSLAAFFKSAGASIEQADEERCVQEGIGKRVANHIGVWCEKGQCEVGPYRLVLDYLFEKNLTLPNACSCSVESHFYGRILY